jgi:pimeloyl-ACP methyl ester carboxylesterase
LKGLGIKEFNILGYSMGGEVALNLVLNHPKSVNKLILIDSGVTFRTKNVFHPMNLSKVCI